MNSDYPTVAGLVKGLQILRALNRLVEATTAGVADETGIPRPTAHRLLETLRKEGYVQRSSLRQPYRLTLMARTLGEGYHDDDWIADIAQPVIDELWARVLWPTDIATYEHGHMVIRATTHGTSPLSIERVSRGRKIAMLNTATGHTYLAFSPPPLRDAILESLDEFPGIQRPPYLERTLKTTLERGYGLRVGGTQSKTSSIAVPIMCDTKVLACLNLNWIHQALKVEVAVGRYLEQLQDAALRIEASYSRYRAPI